LRGGQGDDEYARVGVSGWQGIQRTERWCKTHILHVRALRKRKIGKVLHLYQRHRGGPEIL